MMFTDSDDAIYPEVIDNVSGVTETFQHDAFEKGTTGYAELLSTLVHCNLIVFLGYLSGKLKIIKKDQISGLVTFANNLALPAFIFGGLLNVKIESIKWMVLACIALAKAIVFIIVTVSTLNLTKPNDVKMAGLYGVFITYSNDIALGVPLLLSSHFKYSSQYISYLYFLELIQLTVFNPVAYYMIQRSKQKKQQNGIISILGKHLAGVCKYIIHNSSIISIFLGVTCNVVFHSDLPDVVSHALQMLGMSYPAVALFILGLLLAINCNIMLQGSLVIPGLLITAKNILLPSVVWKVAKTLLKEEEEVERICNFGFLYGTLPPNPLVLLIDIHPGTASDAISLGIVGSMMLSAVSTFLVNSMTFISSSKHIHQFNHYVLRILGYSSVTGTFCCLWVIAFFMSEKQKAFSMQKIQLLIVFSQLLTSIGGLMNAFIPTKVPWILYFQYILSLGGLFSTRTLAFLLAVMLALLQWKGLGLVLHLYKYIMLVGVVTISCALISFFIKMPSSAIYEYNEDRIYPLNMNQLYVLFFVIVLSLFGTANALLFYQHYYTKVTDMNEVKDSYLKGNELSISKCVIFILLICFSTAVSFAVCLWKMFMEDYSGVYSELVILDVVLNYGQGFFSLLVFGLNEELVIEPCLQFLSHTNIKECRSSASNGSLSVITKRICKEFSPRIGKCKQDICKEQNIGSRTYQSCFRGNQLVDWLLSASLAENRPMSTQYGQQLLVGGIISHVNGNKAFHDNLFLYTFVGRD